MSRFLQNFLRDASGRLSDARRQLQILQKQNLADELETSPHLRQIFQQIHTLKGSAAAFGIETVRESAHQLENLLNALCFGQTVCDAAALAALSAGIENLETALKSFFNSKRNPIPVIPQDLQILIGDSTFNENQTKIEHEQKQLPNALWNKLNEFEKRHLQQAISGGASVYVLAVKFSVNDFQDKLQRLRSTLSGDGEIIAALPGAFASPIEISLQIVFAAHPFASTFLEAIECFNPDILFAHSVLISIAEAATPAFLAGRRAAAELEKEIKFELSGGELKLNGKQAGALTTALLHLITNAVAHGIEPSGERFLKKKLPQGTIIIEAEQTATSVHISVVDDGGGIDFEKISQIAQKKFKVKSSSAESDLEQAQQLIFSHGFSTVETLTALAGRGIGLGAAKTAVENAGGTLQVSSEIGLGTRFEIFLPQI